MLKRRAKQKPDNPHLWGTNRVPFDHYTESYDDFKNSTLGPHVRDILAARDNVGRLGSFIMGSTSLTAGISLYNLMSNYEAKLFSVVVVCAAPAMALGFINLKDNPYLKKASKALDDYHHRHKTNPAKANLEQCGLIHSMFYPFFSYRAANILTRDLEKYFTNITSDKLALDKNAARIREFNEGIINKRGDIILRKHPDSIHAPDYKPLKRWWLRQLWNQPFQRARFHITPVVPKETQTATDPKKAAAPTFTA